MRPTSNTAPPRIVVAEDDEDDRLLAEAALQDCGLLERVDFVENGEALLAYLRAHTNAKQQQLPALVLLDLNMPRKDGRQTLREIREDSNLQHVPVVIFTTSDNATEVRNSYGMGANSFITKPTDYNQLVMTLCQVMQYWLHVVQLPRPNDHQPGAYDD